MTQIQQQKAAKEFAQRWISINLNTYTPMKKKLFSLLLVLMASTGTMFAWDYWQIQIGNLYYNIDAMNRTAEVTYQEIMSTANYSGMTSVSIPISVKYNNVTCRVISIGPHAFSSCGSLRSVTIPNSVTSIGNSAFRDCSSLTSLSIGTGVTTIENYAFINCTGLTSVTIPNSVTSIGDYAFYGCSSLASLSIGTGVTSIGNYAFSSCGSLRSVTIPNGVTSIEQYAFSGCNGLTYVSIGKGVTRIGRYTFKNCSSLTSVVWNAKNYTSPYSFYDAPFDDIRSQIASFSIGEDVESIPSYLCYEMDKLTSISIPNKVTSIGKDVFYWCTGLTSITLGNSVTSIDATAFHCCMGCSEIQVSAQNPNFSSEDGVLFNKDKTTLNKCPGGKSGSYSIPKSVTSIGNRAFEACRNLTTITIPNSVTSIGNYAFNGCNGLTSIIIPNSVTSVGVYAFAYCRGLTSVEWNVKNCADFAWEHAPFETDSLSKITSFTIGDEVEYIPAYLCYDMKQLTSVTDYALVPQGINSNAFRNVNISNCTLYVPGNSVAAYQTANVWKDFGNIVSVDIPKPEPEPEPEEVNCDIHYVDMNDTLISSQQITLIVPAAPKIDGFTFIRWEFMGGAISDGLTIQAVYEANEQESAPEVYANPANPAQKLIRNGNVYILKGEKVYTIHGQEVR